MHFKFNSSGFVGSTRKSQSIELGIDKTEVNLMVGLRWCNCWKHLATIPLRTLLLDADVYPILQAFGGANVAQPEGMVLYTETIQKSKQSVQHLVFK